MYVNLPDHVLRRLSLLVVQNRSLYTPLAEIDPEVQELIDQETWRQYTGLELIASEVRSFFLILLIRC
jgi:hypothetical protein